MATPPKKKRVSELYQKLTQLEHIIKRPDTYIGSVERTEKQLWVYNSEKESMEFREVSYVPGIFKIFDEILVNAADNKANDKNMDELKVTIDREKGEISVWNNGRGIPIEIHSKEKIYIPEMIFGHLLTGSNYDDDQAKVTGGRNGYGAKLCNIFSTQFTVETADARQKKKYKQTWTKNMSEMGKAKITDHKGEDYTKVTFYPDFAKFGMTGIDDDLEALFKRRVYDLAGTCKGVAVKLNGSRIPARNFKKYIEMYTKAIKKERGEEAANDASEIITESSDPRWEIGFAVSDGSFQQVSFVNSIATTSGGTHVNYITDQIVARLMDIVKKRNKVGAAMKPNQIRNHIFLFVNAQIVNPAFTSQTKEQLTTKSSQFGSKCQISDDFMKKIAKTEVINNILHFAQQKADQILKKSDGSKRSRMNNPKLTDANKAGTKEGYKCTLILTEGDSAKGLALAGRSVVGPDLFGVFPLRGKLLNVRDASVEQISKNAEIQNIKTFLGLQHKKVYTDTQGLRYGSLMIMTDQDHDGSHIKGLLINFLQVQFPSLLKIPNFLVEFITPIVKIWKGDPKNPSQSKAFYTLPEYEAWKEAHKHEKKWDHKYLKGLGSSTNEDAQQYFNDIDRHHKEFDVMKDEESALIELAFSKKKADERKEWLRQFKPGTYLDMTTRNISYTDFVNKELILFSMADNIRSIPSVIDGLKPGQRKVMYVCLKKNLKKDVKVAELGGVIGGMTAYHHGDASLQGTIVGLAQTFVGSNNVNLLEPSGQFGTRNQGGSDCASARYIHTRLSPFARKLFHQADDPLLKSQTDDDKIIEPEIFVPVLPMILVNGADGIGTGWSSSIPNYNPEDIVANLKRRMDGEEWVPMVPWFRGFKGEVKSTAPDRFQFSGIIHQTGGTEVEITELPVRTWTQDFKDKLEEIIKAEKVPSFIKDYKDYNTHDAVHFIIQMDEKHMAKAVEEGLIEKFKLTKTIATSNLVAFDPQGRITKYANIEAIMDEFYSYRLQMYAKRKEWLLKDLQRELSRLTNQARFIQMIIDGKLVISKKKKAVLIAELQKLGFAAFPKVQDAAKSGELEPVIEEEADDTEEEDSVDASAYDYLLGMALWSLTQERVDKVLRQMAEKEQEVDALMKKSKEDLWKADLDDFIAEWKFQLEDEHNRKRNIRKGRRVSKKFATSANPKAAVKKRKGLGDAFDDSEFEEFAPKAKKRAPAPKPVQRAITAYTAPKSNALKNAMEQRKLYTDGPNDSAAESEPVAKDSLDLFDKAPKPTAARGARGKKPAKYTIDSDSESDFNNSSDALEDEREKSTKSKSVDLSDLDEVIPKPKPRAAAMRKKPQLDDYLDSDFDQPSDTPKAHSIIEDATNSADASDLDEEVVPKPKSRAAPLVAKKLAKPIISDDEDETELPSKTNGKASDVDMSEFDEVIPKPKSRAARPPAKKPVKALISDDEEETEIPVKTSGKASDIDMSDFDEVIPKPKSRGSRPAPKKAAKVVDTDMEDDDVESSSKSKPAAADESDFEEVMPKPKARATKAAPKKGAKATKAKNDSDDDDDVVVATKPPPKKTTKKKAVENSDDEEPIAKPKARAPRANAKKTPAYTLETDSDNGDDLLADLGDMVKGLPKTALKDTQPKEKKQVTKKPVAAAKKLEQSPIAKAYAKRLAKKKVVDSDDDMDMTF